MSDSPQQRLNNGGDHNHLADDGGGGGGAGTKLTSNNDVMSVSMSAAVDLENDPSGGGGGGGRKRSAGAGGVSYSKRSKLRSFFQRGSVVPDSKSFICPLIARQRWSLSLSVHPSLGVILLTWKLFGPSCILRTEALKQTQHSNNNGLLLYLVSLGRVFSRDQLRSGSVQSRGKEREGLSVCHVAKS